MVIKKYCLPLFLLVVSSLVISSLARYDDEFDPGLSNPGISPRREFEECQMRCQQQQQEHGQQQRRICVQRCEQRRRQREEREGRGDDDDTDDLLLPNPRISPRQEFEECQRKCHEQERGQQQRQICLQRCEQRRRQREEREGRGDEEIDDLDGLPNPRVSPRQEFEECQRKCHEQERGQQQRQTCLQRCEQRRRQREEREGRGDEEIDDLPNPRVSPRKEFEQCQRKCHEQERGQQQRQICLQRCEQKRRQREEREGRGDDDTDDLLLPNPRISPRQEFEECQRQCHEQERGQQQRQICLQRCEQRRRQREEREGREHDQNPQKKEAEEKYKKCTQVCERAHQDPSQKQACQRQCLQKYEEDVERERRGRGGGSDNPRKDPEDQYKQCQLRCQQRELVQEGRRECEQECQSKYRERQGKDEEEEFQGQTNHPYHFSSQRFGSRFGTSEGSLKVLEKLNERSKLLKGLENYRIAVLDAAPGTLVAPHHLDADTILVVTKGKGTINIVRQNKKESYNMEISDMVVATAGSTVYFVNQENNEPLQITKLVSPVNIPGLFEEYYPGGGENPQSYFKAFSQDILKQSLSATEDQIRKLVGEQRGRKGVRQSVIVRASQEQLKALTQHATSPSRKGGRESSGPINLQSLTPLYSNDHGKFFETDLEKQKQLREMNVFVNWAELKQGAIMVPHFNSKATVVVKVVEGTGRMEMACPHLARQTQQRWGREGEHQQQQEQEEERLGTGTFQKVKARLSPGDVFIIPAGHPVSVVASEGQTLRMVGFGVNAINNERIFIAGKDNMIKQIEREAKELAFNMPGSEVEQIFNQPKLSYFVPQQSSREEGRPRTHPLNSVLNFAGFA